MRKQGIVITIDGPSGAGKSTVARLTAARLGYVYVDSGAMYRAVAWAAQERGIALEDVPRLVELAGKLDLGLENAAEGLCAHTGAGLRVSVDGRNITQEIRDPRISQRASLLATLPELRCLLVAQLQRLGAPGGVVMEGRDIGTVVFPDAELKIFLDASPEVRAQRRFQHQQELGISTSLEQTREEVHARDLRDRERAASPLLRAPDAVYIDTTALSAEEAVEIIVQLACLRQKAARVNAPAYCR